MVDRSKSDLVITCLIKHTYFELPQKLEFWEFSAFKSNQIFCTKLTVCHDEVFYHIFSNYS